MKILIAEDDELSRMLLRDILQKEPDYEVIEATDGLAAWKVLDQVSKVRKQLDPMSNLEDDARVCHRLGISHASYQNLMILLTEKIAGGVRSIREALATAD